MMICSKGWSPMASGALIRCAHRGVQRTPPSIVARARRPDLVADQQDRDTALQRTPVDPSAEQAPGSTQSVYRAGSGSSAQYRSGFGVFFIQALTSATCSRSSACSSRAALRTFFFVDTATTEIYTLSLHDALPSASCKA